MRGSEPSDEQLARSAQAGNRDAFFELYQRYLRRVYNRVKSKVPRQDVEDVTQDVFIALTRSLGRYEERSRFNTWMYTIVNRQIADYYRRRTRKKSPDAAGMDDLTESSALPDSEDTGVDDRAQLRDALNQLPAHYQDVLLMRYADGLSFADIAEQRGQSVEAVKSLYRRALHALREVMTENG